MKKIYSFIALVAMLCTSMCMFTSCGDDDDAPRHEKLVVSALMPDYIATTGNLSIETVEAVSQAMRAAQHSLAQIDYTSPDGVEKLMANAIKTEVEKLANDVRYELKKEKVKIKLWCTNVKPNIEYIFDCSELQADVPATVATIKSATLTSYAQENFSAETIAKLNEVVDYINNNLAGKTVDTDAENALYEIGNFTINSILEQFGDIASLREVSDPSKRVIVCISVSYSTSKNSDNILNLMLRNFIK